ncbi:hypothetical protein [Bacillus tequilensis]|uniref:hypothetical protein n=1 Tax=Bacillus tequilensis TaxID=227866 RepID=UPI0004679EAC|nr:hypothetical protein [Bacillus tequilensis]MDR4434794.1 hypothetical protein [Bacillus tequilensis]SPU01245.1 Uncharacterised protein [Bacillus tequilensis]
MKPEGNSEQNPKVIKWLTWIIPIVIIGLIFLLKNIENPITNFLFYIVCAGVIILVLFSIIKEKKAKNK